MKIRIEDHVRSEPEKLLKIALATTDRLQLDLYCVAPGRGQKAHSHAAQDKVYYVLKGAGRFSLAGREETLRAGDALVAPAGVEHGLENDGPELLVALVVVAPPPTH
jgi:quercetin dioxygenase-like cupin family protein